MHIVLSQSFNPGDFDLGKTYPHLKVVRSVIQTTTGWQPDGSPPMSNEESMLIYCQHGQESGSWDQSIAMKVVESYQITGSDYATIVSGSASAGESGYQAVSRLVYDWLLDTGKYQGFSTGAL
jgi:hypothetical protein